MSQPSATPMRKPRTDNRPLWDIVFGIWDYPAVLVAHDLKLFPLLAEQPRTPLEVCEARSLAPRPAAALLAVCLSRVGARAGGLLHPHPLAEDYLLDSSPTYFGGDLDLTITHYAVWSFDSLKKAALTDTPQAYRGGREMFTSHEGHADLARTFTRVMHSNSMVAALA